MKQCFPRFGMAALVFCFSVGLQSAGGMEPDNAAEHPSEDRRVFSPSSFWYQPIPADVPLHPDSAAFVEEFLRQKKQYYGTVNINTVNFACPMYVVTKGAPAVKVEEWDSQNKGYKTPDLTRQWEAVPIPDYAQQADGTDAEMCIYQPETDSLWEFWNARKVDGRWEASWGGGMTNVSQSSGIWPPPFGATGTGLPFIGGQITPDELRRGEIEHVMGIALVDCEDSKVISWPAQRSDGQNPEGLPHRIAEGQRFRLDPSVDVEALPLSPVGKIIARAAQKYGFVVWDRAGAISLRGENPKSWTLRGLPDPYEEIFAGMPSWAILQGFPWEKLQFLPFGYGKDEVK